MTNVAIMLMYAVTVSVIIILALKWRKSKVNNGDMSIIPGPKVTFWDILQSNKRREMRPKTHLLFQKLHKTYGSVKRIRLSEVRESLIVSDFDLIYKIMVKEGKPFGGRPSNFVFKNILNSSGILFSAKPDKTWRTLRQVSQKHLRQFGEGLTRLESIITEVAEDMFDDISNHVGKPYNPRNTIFDTALNSIAFLITGERTHTGDDIIEKMREYEGLLLGTVPRMSPMYFNMLNHLPWLKYLGFDKWGTYQRFYKLHDEIWQTVKDMNDNNPESRSICKVLMSHLLDQDTVVTERDAQAASLSLLFAGVITTSTTFHGMINIFAHNKHVQEKLYSEIQATKERSSEGNITLSNRSQMPYARAVLLESLRLTSVVSMGVAHYTMADTELGKYKVPANTEIFTDLWTMHHDEEFWEKPFEFYPERYLDDSGDLVPADHPFRTHLMPFGAGTRVCLGESLAMARLFIWMTTLVDRYEVHPAKDNDISSTDPRNFHFEGVLRPTSYNVLFERRD